ncbi:MAG: phosphoribosyltransferase [Armatimonadetes bacterium]|nr:phosphoribosyltransferase [Armatimonadota bacterium]
MFRDRADAGRRLGEALRERNLARPYVLAIPRGGVVVGYEVAAALGAPLDVIVPRKLRAPLNPELAIGAVAHDGSVYLDERLVKALDVPRDYLEQELAYQSEEIQRRMRAYRGDASPPLLEGMTAIVVDDGIATGSTMIAALRAARRAGPRLLVAAVPVAPPEGAARLRLEADEALVLETPPLFYAVGQFYDDFAQTDDHEVIALLVRRRRELGLDAPGSARTLH